MENNGNSTKKYEFMDYLTILFLAATWGASFLFIKIAVETIPPFTIVAGRITLAAIILYIAMKIAGQSRPSGFKNWLLICGSAAFGNVLPFTMISWGEISVDSGLAAILMSLIPLTTMVLAHFFTQDEKLNKSKIIGIIVGFIGVIILIGPSTLNNLGNEILAQIAIASSAVCYSISTIFNKYMNKMPGRMLAAWIMIISAIMILPLSLIFDQPWALSPDPIAIGAVIILGIFPTALAMLLLLVILRRQGANTLAITNYIVPIFGVIWGVIFLAEQPKIESLIALIFILTGIAISRRKSSVKHDSPNR